MQYLIILALCGPLDTFGEPVAAVPVCDLNSDGVVDSLDIDALTLAILDGDDAAIYDVNLDGVVSTLDRSWMVMEKLGTDYGDSNLDGWFNSTDLVLMFQSGLYETNLPARWHEGDFTGDLKFGSADLIKSLQTGNYTSIPESSSAVLVLAGLVLMASVGIYRGWGIG